MCVYTHIYIPGERNGNPLQYSHLEDPRDRGGLVGYCSCGHRVRHNWMTKYIYIYIAPHSSTLAWKIPWMEEPGGLPSMGLLRVGHDWAISLSCIGEGNGHPLQCSCLENPRDGGAWWAAVYGVVQSQTRLKWLSSSICICIYVYVHTYILNSCSHDNFK